MRLLPASSELAANAGTGSEGHKRSASVDSGASSDATVVVASIDGIDGAIDGSHKSVATGKLRTSPPERAAGVHDPAVHDAKRGRVSTDTASGAPALATHTTTAGSPTAAAPATVSVYTATARAVADPYVSVLDEPNEAPDGGHDEGAPAHSAAAAAARAAAGAAASSAGSEVVIAPSTSAPESSAIINHSVPAHASASATAGAASALGAAASKSDTIVANETSRGDAGSPETPVIWRRPHVVAGAVPIRAFSIGRTSTPAPAPQAGGSKSAVIVANAASRVHAHCPSTPVVSRLRVPRSHVIPGTAPPAAVNGGPYRTFCIGRRISSASTAPPAITGDGCRKPAGASAYACTSANAGNGAEPQSCPARFSALRTVSRAIQRAMDAIRNALIGLYTDGIGPTKADSSASPGLTDEDGCWDGDAPIEAALLALAKRERRRFL